jgi:DNA-binding CsgD family transcriptional regulator
MLIALHDDILPFVQEADTSAAGGDMQEGVAATRPTTSSEYRLDRDACVIGRDPSCQIRVREQRTDISRRHATIRREDHAYIIHDHSMHGTFVNRSKISDTYHLVTDDIIGFANSKDMLLFVDYDQPEQASIVLTDREREVLNLLAAGHSIKRIADELVVSPNTVNSHLKNLYDKLEVNSRSEAVHQARKLRLLRED